MAYITITMAALGQHYSSLFFAELMIYLKEDKRYFNFWRAINAV
jgi:hypothetical protein